ncbi:hypothetical protein [Leptolyngbya sp. FACHB-711]|uniref:hypothetical protein n=1 Tax=Leptolyngbya sp. FACHB-711 TaxID=2692813 RepID=UPI0016884316|nr:hypothetical protein [Leptolyngbya sp. FACHB-711]MBD2025239.1 hypothetical protein [Leptolyngbya sp. FACHB-711]
MPRWTVEARQKQSERIRQLKPWKRSTGPRTRSGKRRSSQNSLKTGEHTQLAKLERSLARSLGISLHGLRVPEIDYAAIDSAWADFFRTADFEEETN